ncbi:hypothetical protein [Ochrobactrum chromiisoli]|uniref:Uncharacterized protein n=1 Tax=Ochrobactrum chromiisoli TaxID=2993941 RepID=A0ABT3QRG2_9HYPH|nr:hypothetical protein [Ochrobactrum chromiisoli]MCX2698177.1 hypothetical protein [Ochrobactrum chromiisoli]
MAQFLHSSVKATHVTKAELQRSKTPVAQHYEINEKTMKKCDHVRDWLLAESYAKQLKALRFRASFDLIGSDRRYKYLF